MQIIDTYFTIHKMGPVMNIYIMPDCHFGSPAFMEDQYERLAAIIEKDPLAYLIFQGDLIDSNRPSTRELKRLAYLARKEEHEQEDTRNSFWIENQIIPKLKRIIKKGRCLGMLDGDHYMLTEAGITTTQQVCIRLGVPYLGDGQVLMRLHFGVGTSRQATMYVIHCQHGINGGGRPGSGVNKLEDMCNIWEGVDAFIRGHSHKGFIFPTSKYFTPQRGQEIKQHDIWLVNTPSFRTGMVLGKTDYAESKCYGATAHKFPVLRLSARCRVNSKRSVKIEVTGELL